MGKGTGALPRVVLTVAIRVQGRDISVSFAKPRRSATLNPRPCSPSVKILAGKSAECAVCARYSGL